MHVTKCWLSTAVCACDDVLGGNSSSMQASNVARTRVFVLEVSYGMPVKVWAMSFEVNTLPHLCGCGVPAAIDSVSGRHGSKSNGMYANVY